MAQPSFLHLAPRRHGVPPPPPRAARLSAAVLLTLALGATVAAVVGILFSGADWPRFRQAGGGAAAAAGPLSLAKGPPPAPRSPSLVRQPDPRSITLTAVDLPGGYHVLKAGPASFSSGGGLQTPPSWDVVFEPDPGQRADYQLAESLAVVYPSPTLAGAAVETQAALERTARASEQLPRTVLGDRMTVWVEPVPDRPQFALIRVTWQSLNVVGQVSVLGQVGPGQLERAVGLAMAQQERIAAPAPARSGS